MIEVMTNEVRFSMDILDKLTDEEVKTIREIAERASLELALELAQEEFYLHENRIAALEGKDKAFYKHITDAKKKMHAGKYFTYSQIQLLAKIYDNNFCNASYDCFSFGFYQGQKYQKELQKQ